MAPPGAIDLCSEGEAESAGDEEDGGAGRPLPTLQGRRRNGADAPPAAAAAASAAPAARKNDGAAAEEGGDSDAALQMLTARRNMKQDELNKLSLEIANLQRERELLDTRLRNLQAKRSACEEDLRDMQREAHGAARSRNWQSEDFNHSKAVRRVLRETFGFDGFRSLQLSAINATLSGVDTFVVMPTGAGKSLIYQLPAVYEARKLTVVVSPLLSLSRDQIMSLLKKNIAAAMLCGETSREDSRETLHAIRALQLRLLYVTPEKITKSKQLMSALEKLNERDALGRFVIDEAHCCSTMGHDFRPDYRKLHILKQRFPQVPILAVTATATARVESSVCETLLGRAASARHSWVRFRTTFNRTNLVYEVIAKSSAATDQIRELADMIKTRFPRQCGIIYCFSRKDTEETAGALTREGIGAAPYHADLDPATKQLIHHKWSTYVGGTAAGSTAPRGASQVQVICATSAFGMGIDKPDVRFVVHISIPKNMEAYCQESGRAGRDGNEAHCVLFYRRQDVFRVSSLVADTPQGDQKLLEIVRYCENLVECRRHFMASVFGEVFDKDKMCRGKCDVCARRADESDYELGDFTAHARTLVATLQDLLRGPAKQANVTMTKLLLAWRKDCKPKTKAGKAWSVAQGEELCMRLLLNNVFQIKWRSSSYKTNAYIEPGAYASSLASGSFKVRYHTAADSAAVAATSESPSALQRKRKSSGAGAAHPSKRQKPSTAAKRKKQTTAKGRLVVVDGSAPDDSDDDDMDPGAVAEDWLNEALAGDSDDQDSDDNDAAAAGAPESAAPQNAPKASSHSHAHAKPTALPRFKLDDEDDDDDDDDEIRDAQKMPGKHSRSESKEGSPGLHRQETAAANIPPRFTLDDDENDDAAMTESKSLILSQQEKVAVNMPPRFTLDDDENDDTAQTESEEGARDLSRQEAAAANMPPRFTLDDDEKEDEAVNDDDDDNESISEDDLAKHTTPSTITRRPSARVFRTQALPTMSKSERARPPPRFALDVADDDDDANDDANRSAAGVGKHFRRGAGKHDDDSTQSVLTPPSGAPKSATPAKARARSAAKQTAKLVLRTMSDDDDSDFEF